jgi:hypothetical protein
VAAKVALLSSLSGEYHIVVLQYLNYFTVYCTDFKSSQWMRKGVSWGKVYVIEHAKIISLVLTFVLTFYWNAQQIM